MPTPSLFPIFLKAQGGDSQPPAGVVGGFIEGTVQEVPRAVAQGSPVNAGFSGTTVRATVVPTFSGRLVEPIRATVLPAPINAELLDGR